MSLPATPIALMDRRLHRSDLLVYGAALQELDVADFRPFKLLWAQETLGMRKGNVSRSLRRLVRLGYLNSGVPAGRERTYVLTYRPQRLSPVITNRVA